MQVKQEQKKPLEEIKFTGFYFWPSSAFHLSLSKRSDFFKHQSPNISTTKNLQENVLCRVMLVIYAEWRWWYMLSGIGDICIVTLVMGESGGGGVAPCGAAHTQPVPAASRPARRHCIALLSPLLSSLLQLLTAINTSCSPNFSPGNFGFVPTRGLKVSGGKFVFFSLRIYYWRWWWWYPTTRIRDSCCSYSVTKKPS